MDDIADAFMREHVRPGERIVWKARPSLVGLVPILASGLGAIAFLATTAYLGIDEPGVVLRGTPALVVAVLGVLLGTGRRFIQLRFTTFVVTDERFYAITSFLETNARSVPLARMSGVSLRQGVFGRVLGLWHARIATYGEGERALDLPAIRDGEGLLREASAGMRRGANVAWLTRGD